MNVNSTDINFHLKNPRSDSKQSFSESDIQGLSFQNIRSFRHNFEKGITIMRTFLGDEQHQTMIVAMYEGTEQLLNQNVSEFAVLEYLEGLKLIAKELRQQGVFGDQFRTVIMEHSSSTVRELLRSS
ncbi:MAG: hypothetical protein QGI65_01165 [SAR324 cluster bacterium]|jgi:hypothetical protein|nr:hypothetical protein [SAR324 cluster bacterium]|tara:strand:- start:99 stop:479 length:381 start_codon:yes stop_codon:yes gene_type:complete